MPIHQDNIVDELIAQGVITQDQMSIARIEQTQTPSKPLIQTVIDLGFVSDSIVRSLVESDASDSGKISLSSTIPSVDALNLVPVETARQFELVPVDFNETKKVLTIAMADTMNLPAIDRVRVHAGVGIKVESIFANVSEIQNAIDRFYGYEFSIDGILKEIEAEGDTVEELDADEYSQPIIRLVDAILIDAVRSDASDIHFEPEQHFLRLRYRVDGVLSQIRVLHKNYLSPIVVRLKVMSGMNIAENRAPQDGQISLKVAGKEIDFRVAVQPTVYGENMVLRVLNREKGIVPLDKMGISEHSLNNIKLLMARPEGVILVTGPTGSGKTTTLYSMLNARSSEKVNIMTLEDPVEYPLPLVRQTSINQSVKLDFTTGIRSIMRQDPDIILVGEVRDEDTAQMTLRAAMTGHQVYTTLHTNSALGAIPRLTNIGVLPSILSGNIIGVLGQRLVRKLCQSCKQPYEPTDQELILLGVEREQTKNMCTYGACEQCGHSGYKGRKALVEVLRITPELDELIAESATQSALKEKAIEQGFISLLEEGVSSVLDGSTTIDELTRVVDMTQRLHDAGI